MPPKNELEDISKTGYWILKYNKLEKQIQWQIPLTAILAFCAGVAFHSQHVEKQLKKQKQNSDYIESKHEVTQSQTSNVISYGDMQNHGAFEIKAYTVNHPTNRP